MKKNKIPFKKVLSAAWWTVRLGFKISPVVYSMLFLNKAFNTLIPLSKSFVLSLIFGELISLVTSHTTSVSNSMLLYISGVIVLEILDRLNASMGEYAYMRLNYMLDLKLFPRYLHKLADLDMQYHEDPEFKTKLRKVDDALSWRVIGTMQSIASFSTALLGLGLIVSIFFTINIFLVLALLVPVIINYFINVKFGRQIWSIFDYKGEQKKHAEHSVNGLKTKDIIAESKIYGFAPYISSRFVKANEDFINEVMKQNNKKFSIIAGNTILTGFILGMIQFYLITQTLVGRLTFQNYSFYLGSIGQVNAVFDRIQDNFSRIYEFSLYVTELKDFFNLKNHVEISSDPKKVNIQAPKIEFRNVSFKYPGSKRYILKDLSFTINPGEKVSLVGENGAGKTTLIKLLARFYDVTKGEILINDINIKELDLTSYYKLWGVLFQYFARYWFTVRENIGLGNIEDINNLKLIKEAALKADAKKTIEALPNQYENMLSPDFKDGVELSGGQWQKIGIARGMFADPKFIVLDEPTSALDALAEARVFEQIHEIAKDTTMLIVSHRFATVRNADKILVLENGKVTEQGNHDQLMIHNGLYFQMFTKQAEGYK